MQPKPTLDFYPIPDSAGDIRYWQSHYRLDGEPFRIYKFIKRGDVHYSLDVPARFFVQFKNHKRKHLITCTSLEEAQSIAQLMFKGKAAEIEDTTTFFDPLWFVDPQGRK